MNTNDQTPKTCGTIYTSRDGGSTLKCTETKGHAGQHYADAAKVAR